MVAARSILFAWSLLFSSLVHVCIVIQSPSLQCQRVGILLCTSTTQHVFTTIAWAQTKQRTLQLYLGLLCEQEFRAACTTFTSTCKVIPSLFFRCASSCYYLFDLCCCFFVSLVLFGLQLEGCITFIDGIACCLYRRNLPGFIPVQCRPGNSSTPLPLLCIYRPCLLHALLFPMWVPLLHCRATDGLACVFGSMSCVHGWQSHNHSCALVMQASLWCDCVINSRYWQHNQIPDNDAVRQKKGQETTKR